MGGLATQPTEAGWGGGKKSTEWQGRTWRAERGRRTKPPLVSVMVSGSPLVGQADEIFMAKVSVAASLGHVKCPLTTGDTEASKGPSRGQNCD